MEKEVSQNSIQNNEKTGNTVMFIYCCAIAVAGWGPLHYF